MKGFIFFEISGMEAVLDLLLEFLIPKVRVFL